MSTKFGTIPFQNSIVLFYIQNKRRPSTSACSLPIYNFLHHDLVCPMSDAVHLPHPRLRFAGLQLLRHALGVCVLFYQPKKEFLRLLLDVRKVAAQCPGGQQVIIQHPVVRLQKSSPPLPVNADGSVSYTHLRRSSMPSDGFRAPAPHR